MVFLGDEYKYLYILTFIFIYININPFMGERLRQWIKFKVSKPPFGTG